MRLARARRRRDDLAKGRGSGVADETSAEIREWEDWLAEIEDTAVVSRAKKMDIDLDDLPIPADEGNSNRVPSHYETSPFGNDILRFESRQALRKAMRERSPAYRKEQRETWDLLLKGVALAIGLVGATSGLVALLKK
jgi:hypothetical protein